MARGDLMLRPNPNLGGFVGSGGYHSSYGNNDSYNDDDNNNNNNNNNINININHKGQDKEPLRIIETFVIIPASATGGK